MPHGERQQRNGSVWFVGGIFEENEQRLQSPLVVGDGPEQTVLMRRLGRDGNE